MLIGHGAAAAMGDVRDLGVPRNKVMQSWVLPLALAPVLL